MQLSDRAVLEGFNVAKYNACEEWDAKMWQMALSERVYMRYLLRPHEGVTLTKGPMPRSIFVDQRDFYLGVAEARIKDPIRTREASDRSPRIYAPSVISDFMLTDIFNVTDIATNAEESGLQEYKWMCLRDVEKAIGRPSNRLYVGIDLHAPDVVILEKFGNWLKKTRNASGITPKYPAPSFKDKDFKKWHTDKLLPYLDLAFWGKMSGHALTETDMGNKLFPSDFEPRTKMRSIATNALRLISRECVLTLATQCQTY